MNAFYNWTNDEIMIAERMKEIQREAETIRLLRNAGLANAGERTAIAFANTLVKLGERLKRKYTRTQQAYQATGGKYVA
jgi:hypothetical protein